MPDLLGHNDQNIKHLAKRFDVDMACRGNKISIRGSAKNVVSSEKALKALYAELEDGGSIETIGDIDDAIYEGPQQLPLLLEPKTQKASFFKPRNESQAKYMSLLDENDIVFATGPAGTGKTYIAVAKAVAHLARGDVDRIVLCRPAVEAGEKLGFLPGDMKEKIDPYLRPLYDALNDLLPEGMLTRHLATGKIEIAPLAFMRGRTLSRAFVILDESQNTTPVQMKMFLTRIGEGSSMVITGDLSQIDLPGYIPSGLADATSTLEGVQGIGFIQFTNADVVRHPLIGRIVEAYDMKK